MDPHNPVLYGFRRIWVKHTSGPNGNPGKRSPSSKDSPRFGGVFVALVLEYLGRLAIGGFGRLIT
jgi:hypothetical protein